MRRTRFAPSPTGSLHVGGAQSALAVSGLDDAELAASVGAPVELAPVLRDARDLDEAREFARAVLDPEPVELPPDAAPTLERFRELLVRANGTVDAREVVRELKAVGGDLKALRLALTGRDRGPALWTVIAVLPREEALRRVDAAL
jgi:glutamyl/glutaminyl-tRNA synthetase